MKQERKLTIVNKVPHAVAAVIEQQFRTLSALVEPLRTASADAASRRELTAAVNEVLQSYKQLASRIDEGED